MRLWTTLRAAARNRRGIAGPPRFLTYTVTFACNARCVMCDSWRMDGRGDLTVEEIGRIFAQIPPLDAVRLTGGEPFVRQDLGDIVRLAGERLRPLAMHVTTNGFLTDRIVRVLEGRDRSVPMTVLVSVDGEGRKHDEVRGHDRAWEMAIRTLRALAPRQGELNVRLRVNQTIVDAEGLEHYRRLKGVLRPLGLLPQPVIAYETSATYNLERGIDVAPTEPGRFDARADLDPRALRAWLAEVQEDLRALPYPERLGKRYYLSGIGHRLLGGAARPNPRCVALNAHLRIFPDGTVPTCQFNSHAVGSLRERSFEEVWSGEPAGVQREWVARCPGCWAECEVVPSAVYTGDILKEALRRNTAAAPERREGGRA